MSIDFHSISKIAILQKKLVNDFDDALRKGSGAVLE